MDVNEAQNHPKLANELQAEVRDLPCDFGFRSATGLAVGIERKTWDNLIASVGSGEMADQARGMMAECDVLYLLAEGWRTVSSRGKLRTAARQTAENPWPYDWNWLEMYLAEMQEAGFRLIHSPNLGHTARVILALYRWWQRPECDHSALRALKEDMARSLPLPVHILAHIPGYGPARARAALQRFGTLARYLDATPAERAAVPGVGKFLAGQVDVILQEGVNGIG